MNTPMTRCRFSISVTCTTNADSNDEAIRLQRPIAVRRLGWRLTIASLAWVMGAIAPWHTMMPLHAEEGDGVVFRDSFDKGADRWQPTDAKKWKITETEDGNPVYHLLGKSDYNPPHRSPHSVSLIKDLKVASFVMTARVRTLQTSRGHRDMCVFFNYQDPAHFYYVHLGEKTDPHSNQIFVVDDAARLAISETTNQGTPWSDDQWHQVKIVRHADDGLIEIYFDNMDKPQMVAHDKRFGAGQIGLGSFDDLGQWDDVVIRQTGQK